MTLPRLHKNMVAGLGLLIMALAMALVLTVIGSRLHISSTGASGCLCEAQGEPCVCSHMLANLPPEIIFGYALIAGMLLLAGYLVRSEIRSGQGPAAGEPRPVAETADGFLPSHPPAADAGAAPAARPAAKASDQPTLDEERLLAMVTAHGGAILQGELVAESGLHKVKVTRLLHRLEERGLLVRQRRGLTNLVLASPEPATPPSPDPAALPDSTTAPQG
ncbi:MAG: MarR family transcriptional regulator [Thermodesulfobacteriota bacterium]